MIADYCALTPDVLLRPAATDDAAALARAYRRNRDHLRPWEPNRNETFFTTEGQADRLRDMAALRRAGRMMPWVLADGRGEIVGLVNLANIVHNAFRSTNLGYWVDAGHAGKGLATAAVLAVCRDADERLGLHRIEAGTVLTNTASQRVLEKCGFELIGTARNYLHIDGAWRDHLLFQKILNDRPA
ncbi:alanine acetyltransferase [Streptomyces cinnamoneus]|uniref:Alanine acetyltransferase n=1 Tax=Streptomyces cinnamoneus TaxID=53446 RepID=A0A2G1XLI8_STRCJ|nr:GNAT family protein [Streptomyces cinnamoneus]PHQ52102.1 alanine acetyltransferase [Streptomyces cinnamoneus]PPT16182.1 N-acetyltransferase [Streptomyces cinnamoneus]